MKPAAVSKLTAAAEFGAGATHVTFALGTKIQMDAN